MAALQRRWLGAALAGALLTAGAVTLTTAQGAPMNHASSLGPDGAGPLADEQPFLAENEAAMNKMMADMAVTPTGDIDHDFVAMMVPHHQGAIDMAEAVLRYGRNETIRRLAQEIIVTQQQEIAAMRLAIGDELPPSVASPTQPPRALLPNPNQCR
jgi:uncharacterized protein (DUF305 family)